MQCRRSAERMYALFSPGIALGFGVCGALEELPALNSQQARGG